MDSRAGEPMRSTRMVGFAEGRRGAVGPCRGHTWGPRHVAHLQPRGAVPGEPCLGLEELTAALAALTKSGSVRDSGAGSEGGELQHTNYSGRAGGALGCAPVGRGRGFPQLVSWGNGAKGCFGDGGRGARRGLEGPGEAADGAGSCCSRQSWEKEPSERAAGYGSTAP